MEEKETYTIQELFELLPITIAELARQSEINEVTLARIRDGKSTRRSTVNKLLLTMSKIYNLPLSIRNVTEINSQTNKKVEAKEAKRQEKSADQAA
jgi:predicted transcriptional regulator